MTTPAELLKTAAAEIDRLTAEVAQLKGDNVVLAQTVKTAAELKKTAGAELGSLADQASKVLLDRGLVKSAQDADKLANLCLNDHSQALQTIIKVAGYVSTTPKIGTVVLSDDSKPETSAEVWERHASKRLAHS